MRKTIIFISVILAVCIGYTAAVLYADEMPITIEKNIGGLGNAPLNVIGTKTGTTTVPVGFYAVNAASTTYPIFIGRDIDTATFTIGVDNATTSAANIMISVLASEDDECDTATTTTSYTNQVIVEDVAWTDAASHIIGVDDFFNYSSNSSGFTIPAATTTLSWINPVIDVHKEFTLTNLNTQCLALQVSASSTEVWATVTTKQR